MEEVAAADGSGESISGGRIEFVADDKTALSISTETVRQGDLADGTLEAANIALEMRSQDGSVFNANAERGSVDVRGKAILLSGNARMTAFGGYNVLSDSFLVSQEGDKSPKETRLSSLGEVFFTVSGWNRSCRRGSGQKGSARSRRRTRHVFGISRRCDRDLRLPVHELGITVQDLEPPIGVAKLALNRFRLPEPMVGGALASVVCQSRAHWMPP